jgi:hypothetical protein
LNTVVAVEVEVTTVDRVCLLKRSESPVVVTEATRHQATINRASLVVPTQVEAAVVALQTLHNKQVAKERMA